MSAEDKDNLPSQQQGGESSAHGEEFEVVCITREPWVGRGHGRITRLGIRIGDRIEVLSEEAVVKRVRAGERFFVSKTGSKAYLKVTISARGRLYVETIADRTERNNLETLPACSEPMREHQVTWWLFLLQGVAAIVLGFMLLTRPAATADVIVAFIGFYWLVSGLFAIVRVFTREDRSNWARSLLIGLLGILAGIAVLDYPVYSVIQFSTTVVIFIAILGLVMGVLEIIRGIQGDGFGAFVFGVLNVLIGLWLLFNHIATVMALLFMLGVFGILLGMVLVYFAFQLRGQVREPARPMAWGLRLLWLQGVAVIAFAFLVFTLLLGATTIAFVVVTFIGAYWLVVGLIAVFRVYTREDESHWILSLLIGILGILAGIFVLMFRPFQSLTTPIILLAVLGLVMGVLEIIRGIQGDGFGAFVFGVLNILIGLWLLLAQVAVFSIFLLGLFGLVTGILLIYFAIPARDRIQLSCRPLALGLVLLGLILLACLILWCLSLIDLPYPCCRATITATYTPTSTFTSTSTLTPTITATPTSTLTPTITATLTSTLTPTTTATPTSTLTPTTTATPTSTLKPTATPTSSSTSSPTATSTPTVSTPVPSSSTCATQGGELLIDGDFESGFAENGVAFGWSAFNNGGDATRYSYHDDKWLPVVLCGNHSQLIEISTLSFDIGEPDRYSGIYHTVPVVSGGTYWLQLNGMIRILPNDADRNNWSYMVQWGIDPNGGSDWKQVQSWQNTWNSTYPRLVPGMFASQSANFNTPSNKITLFIRVWKKWPFGQREVDVNLDRISLLRVQ